MRWVLTLILTTMFFGSRVQAQDTAVADATEPDSTTIATPSTNEVDSDSAAQKPAEGNIAADPGKSDEQASEATAGTSADSPEPENVTAPAAVADSSQGAARPAESTEQQTASLAISSVPDGAVVVIDGEPRGKTPVTISSLAAGDHDLELRKKGFYLKKATVILQPGASEDVSLELTAPASLIVTSEPSGADVSIGGKAVGTTPMQHSTLKPAEYAVRVSHDGYETFNQSVTLENGGSDSLHIVLQKVESQPPMQTRTEPVDTMSQNRTGLSFLDKVALGVFLAFSTVILVVELAGTED